MKTTERTELETIRKELRDDTSANAGAKARICLKAIAEHCDPEIIRTILLAALDKLLEFIDAPERN